jgi:hypothetical protein
MDEGMVEIEMGMDVPATTPPAEKPTAPRTSGVATTAIGVVSIIPAVCLGLFLM